MNLNVLFSGAALIGGLACPVLAAPVSVSVDSYALEQTGAAIAAYQARHSGASWTKVEDFEDKSSWNGRRGTENAVVTHAGTLRGVSQENGSGHTAINGGRGLQVRDTALAGMEQFTNVWGRQNLSTGGKNWLDSNDLNKMVWDIGAGSGLGKFNQLSFFLTDVGDIRGTDFTVSVARQGHDTVTRHIGAQRNGTVNLVGILFDDLVDAATVTLSSAHNDGFGLDEISVARVAPIPLPPAAPLLLAGVGLLALVRNRRSTTRA